MLSTHALSNAISTELAQGSQTQKKRQTNLKQNHKFLVYPFCLHGMQTTAVSVWISPQPPSLEVCLTPDTLPILLLPHLTLLPFKYCLQPPRASLQAFQPGALSMFHILPCTLVSLPSLPGAKPIPAAPHQQTGGGPTGSTGWKTSQLGAFYNVSQTKPRLCQITVTCSLNNCFL